MLRQTALILHSAMLKYCHKPCNCQYLQGFYLLHGMQGVSGSSPLGIKNKLIKNLFTIKEGIAQKSKYIKF